MDLFERLRADHRRVLSEIALIEASVGGLGRAHHLEPEIEAGLRALLELLERQFATHLRVEEEELFPRLVGALPETRFTVAPLSAEHVELTAMLATLREQVARPASQPRDEQIAVQVRDLADLLRIHVRKEEAVVFQIAEHSLDPAELARMAGTHAEPEASDPPARAPREGTKGSRS